MRGLRSLLVPILFGLVLLTVALVTRTGILARKDPGRPINSAMREALGRLDLPPEDLRQVEQRYPEATVSSSGIRSVVERPGEGTRRPKRGQTVAVHYRGRLLDGTPIDESYSRGKGPLIFHVGEGRVIAGWDEAVLEMTEGEKRTIIIPHWLGYGEKGLRGLIPPSATLVYEIELLEIR